MTKRLPRAWLCPISRDELTSFHQELYEVAYESVPQQIRTQIGNRLATLMSEYMGKPLTPQLVKFADSEIKKWAEWWNRVEASSGLQIIRAGAVERRNGLDLDLGFTRYGVRLEVTDWYNKEYGPSERILGQLKRAQEQHPYLNYIFTLAP